MLKQCQQCGKLYQPTSNYDVFCENCYKENEESLKHLGRDNNIQNCCINKTFIIDNVVFKNEFIPLLIKLKINQSQAIRKLIEYAIKKPQILSDTDDISDIDKFVEYFINNSNDKISKRELRATKFVNGNKFKSFFAENYKEIKEKLRLRGYELLEVSGTKNSKFYMLSKM